MKARINKQLQCLMVHSLRELVEQINSLGIQKEDVLYTDKDERGFFCLYYE